MNKGYIKLHRDILDEPVWQCSTHEQRSILITLMLLANHSEAEWVYRGKKYSLKPGQLITSLSKLATLTNTSVKIVRTALRLLEETYGFLKNDSSGESRVITIVGQECAAASGGIDAGRDSGREGGGACRDGGNGGLWDRELTINN